MVVGIYYIAGGAIIGAILGARLAKTRGGSKTDMLHYGSVLAIALALAGLLVSVLLSRFFAA
jgi:uncharacterized membrane protein AbrB (regulator of aidB expression)